MVEEAFGMTGNVDWSHGMAAVVAAQGTRVSMSNGPSASIRHTQTCGDVSKQNH